jgi:hypothetical protein
MAFDNECSDEQHNILIKIINEMIKEKRGRYYEEIMDRNYSWKYELTSLISNDSYD